jgi:membrane-associated phospholipid phosphatase
MIRLGVAAAALALVIACGGPAARAEPPADPVLSWNDQTNRAIQATETDAFQASRALALESIAVLDTVRSLAGAPGLMVRLAAPKDVKPEVAVAAAAHAMLRHLFPSRQAALDATLEAALAAEPDNPSRARAVAFGEAVADAVFAVRDRDGWNLTRNVAAGTGAGQWRPTPPRQLAALAPQWAAMTPFVLTAPNQFRPAGPPALDTPAFREAAAAVEAIGGARSTLRTPAQTEIARYWSDAIGTYAPAGHWNAIAATLLSPMRLGLDAEAQVFAELNVALADAGIAIADAKYTYLFWRPVTAIRLGGDGMKPDPAWSPLLETPNHPSYISGHSGFSGAAAVVLTARFGARPFSFASASVPGVTRTFASFQQAAEEAAISRVFGGIHFAFDNVDGLSTGRQVGAWTLSAFRRLAEDRGPLIVMDPSRTRSLGIRSLGTRSLDSRPLTGYALDNASPVTAVMVSQNGGPSVRIAVDAGGRFAIPPRQLGSIGRRDLVVTASSASGRTTTASLTLDDPPDDGVYTAPVTVK